MKKLSKLLIVFIAMICLLSGCSKKEAKPKEVDLHETLAAILDDENMPAMMEVEAEMLPDFYFFNSDDAKQFAIAMPLMNVKATEFILVEANEGHLDAVKAGVKKRLESLDEIWSQYLPDQYELVKNAQFVEAGNYYCVIIAENAEEIAKNIKEALQ